MTNAAVNQAVNPMVQAAIITGMGKAGAAQVGTGDIFALLLQNMMAIPGAQSPEMMGQIQNLLKDEQKEGTELAMQMMAEMFASNIPLADTVVQQNSTENLLQLGLINGNEGSANILAEVPNKKLTAESTPTGQLFAVPTEEAAKNEVKIVAVPQTMQQQTDSQTTLLDGQAQFRNSIMEAQKLIKTKQQEPSKAETNVVDIEKLQNEVNIGKYNHVSEISNKEITLPNANELLSQVRTGIAENLGKGKNEFVVKLKPEGLGEITVKMVESDSRISLSIITSNTQVAKLISGEITALRDSLRQYNADVHEVVSQSQNSYAANQNEQFGHSFTGHRQQQFTGQERAHFDSNEDFSTNMAEGNLEMKLASGLDTYI